MCCKSRVKSTIYFIMEATSKSERNITSLGWIALILLGIGMIAALTYSNYCFAQSNPGGTDFLVHWVGMRALIFEGESPYSDEVTDRIRTITYGDLALSGEQGLRVAYYYPLYSTLFFAAFASIENYDLARATWMTLLEINLAALALVSVRLLKWKLSSGLLVCYLLFSFLWYKAVRGVINGNAVIVVALLIALSLWAVREHRDALAGVLLASMTIKPHVVLLYFVFVLFWGFSRRRWKLIGWTVGSLLFLVLLGMLIIPDWLLQNLQEALRYPGNVAGSAGAALEEMLPGVGPYLAIGLSAIIGIALIWEWRAAWGRDFSGFLWSTCITLVFSQLIGIQTDPGNFIILYVPLVFVFAGWQQRWGKRGDRRSVLLMLGLFLGLWVLFFATVKGEQQHPIMFFPLPLVLLIGLYSVRTNYRD
jgi:hypothetical protein